MGDKNERTVYANPKFCQMMGYTLKEMLGRESYDFWDKESAQRVRSVNTTLRKQGASSSYEGNLLTKSGDIVPVLLSGTPLPDGGTVGIITDLSELKKKQEAEKVLGSAVQYSNDAILIFNKKGEITSWNRGAKIIFGYKKEEIMGKSIDKIFSKEDVHELFGNPKVLYNIELTGFHRNSEPISVSATLTPVLSEDKKSANYCLLIARDVTHQAKAEEELALKYEKMKEAYNKFGIIRRQMDYIFDILELFKGSSDQKSMADFIVSSLIMLTRTDACILRIFNLKKNTLDLISSFGVGDDWRGKASLKFNHSLAQKVFEKKESLKIIDVTKEPRYQSANLAKKNNLCSLLLIPLRFKTKPVGTLSLYARPEKKLEIFENEFIERYARLIEIVVGTMF